MDVFFCYYYVALTCCPIRSIWAVVITKVKCTSKTFEQYDSQRALQAVAKRANEARLHNCTLVGREMRSVLVAFDSQYFSHLGNFAESAFMDAVRDSIRR